MAIEKAAEKSAAKKSVPKKSSSKKATPKKDEPKTASGGSAPLPGTLERSPAKVQRTYEKTLASAEAEYGDEARAHRTAWGSVKNVAEKRGDHWELKDETGPSDPRSQQPAEQKRAGVGETFGGVDVIGNTRDQLVERAKKAGIRGYSRMTKAELGRQLSRHE
jgi:cation transport regulator ChaB